MRAFNWRYTPINTFGSNVCPIQVEITRDNNGYAIRSEIFNLIEQFLFVYVCFANPIPASEHPINGSFGIVNNILQDENGYLGVNIGSAIQDKLFFLQTIWSTAVP